MTTKEAAESIDAPVSRIRKAIQRGWLKAEKVRIGETRRIAWSISDEDFKAALKHRNVVTRIESRPREVLIFDVKRLTSTKRRKQKFATNAGAAQMVELCEHQNRRALGL